MSTDHDQDLTMTYIRTQFEASGLTLHELGLRMGYPPETARKSAWQFIKKTDDPRVSMLRKFARALDIPIEELIAEKKDKSK